jgi:hypothetical protein
MGARRVGHRQRAPTCIRDALKAGDVKYSAAMRSPRPSSATSRCAFVLALLTSSSACRVLDALTDAGRDAALGGGGAAEAAVPDARTDVADDAAAPGDASPHDAGGSGCSVVIDCAAPPADCRYEGGDPCRSCGTLVCDDAGTDVARLSCGSTPLIDAPRACAASADCVVADHQIDCCGTHIVTGIRADADVLFQPAEARCRDSYGDCKCATRVTVADDGSSQTADTTAAVSCQAGRCVTRFVPTQCSGQGDECGAGFQCCYPCGIPGCTSRCEPACADGAPGCVAGCLLRP